MSKAYLVLSNGKVFEGQRIGYDADTIGEIVFTTGMVGYIETLTDPSYAGQIVIQTFPLIGNYGIIEEDFEGVSAVKGYVVREMCTHPSNFRCQYDLDTYLKNKKIPGICGVDTRELTRIIREEGVMNAILCSSVPEDLSAVLNYTVSGVVAEVSCKQAETYPAEEILKGKPDGLMLSNGPGDPAENTYCIEQIRKLVGQLPIFGICLGHQLTALAMGGQTMKLKYGHRGGNQPVKEVLGQRTFITSQNHGYAVVSSSLAGIGREIFVNANDGSCEGMEYPGKNCFTVQFHPEACSGPKDTSFLFDRFISMMGE